MAIGSDELDYTELTSINRTEGKTGGPSVVRKDLYRAMAELYEKKSMECDRIIHSDGDSILFEGASDKKKKTQKVMKDIVSQRMKKIFDLAFRTSIGGNEITDMLTPEEQVLYDTLLDAAKAHWALLDRKKKVTIPDITQPDVPPEPVKEEPTVIGMTVENVTESDSDVPEMEVIVPPESEAVPIDDGFSEIPEDEDEDPRNIVIDVPEEQTEGPAPTIQKDEATPGPPIGDPISLTIVRILEDLDEDISGIDRTYSLRKEDIVRMPQMLARVLVNRNLAKIVNHA